MTGLPSSRPGHQRTGQALGYWPVRERGRGLLVRRIGFESLGDGAKGLRHDDHDELGVAASPAHPFGDGGDSVSEELENARREVPGEGDVLGRRRRLRGVVVGRVRSGIAGTS